MMANAEKQHAVVSCCMAAVMATFVGLCVVIVDQRRRLARLKMEVKRQGALKNAEHSGRISAEKELRAFMSSRLEADGGLFFAPIATVHSCFKDCVGTPRQGQFAPSTRAQLVFERSSVSPVALDGLESFSHVWIFWAFHLNTNAKDARAHSGVRPDSRGHTFPAKVSPPFLKKRLETVDAAERSVGLSGVDLVDGTPVLDIKPFVPDYDCPRALYPDQPPHGNHSYGEGVASVRVADWVGASVKYRRMVEWAPEAEFQLKEACSDRERDRRTGGRGEKRFFAGDYEGAKRAISESLAVDVRSLRKMREAAASPTCTLLFDGMRVEFSAVVKQTNHHAVPTISSMMPAVDNLNGAGLIMSNDLKLGPLESVKRNGGADSREEEGVFGVPVADVVASSCSSSSSPPEVVRVVSVVRVWES